MSGRWAGRPQRPPEWFRLAGRIRKRDGFTCQECFLPGRDVDHRDRNGPDEEWNLRVLCRKCHAAKSSREGNEARHAFPERRAREAHPGLLE